MNHPNSNLNNLNLNLNKNNSSQDSSNKRIPLKKSKEIVPRGTVLTRFYFLIRYFWLCLSPPAYDIFVSFSIYNFWFIILIFDFYFCFKAVGSSSEIKNFKKENNQTAQNVKTVGDSAQSSPPLILNDRQRVISDSNVSTKFYNDTCFCLVE